MICILCKHNIIEPGIGGYLCSQGHLQCLECFQKGNEVCTQCGGALYFVHLKYSPVPVSTAVSDDLLPPPPPSQSESANMQPQNITMGTFPCATEPVKPLPVSYGYAANQASRTNANGHMQAYMSQCMGYSYGTQESSFFVKNPCSLSSFDKLPTVTPTYICPCGRSKLMMPACGCCNRRYFGGCCAMGPSVPLNTSIGATQTNPSLMEIKDQDQDVSNNAEENQIGQQEHLSEMLDAKMNIQKEMYEGCDQQQSPEVEQQQQQMWELKQHEQEMSNVESRDEESLKIDQQKQEKLQTANEQCEGEPQLSEPGQQNWTQQTQDQLLAVLQLQRGSEREQMQKHLPHTQAMFVMQATGVPAPCLDAFESIGKEPTKVGDAISIDTNMQKVLKTMQEDPHPPRGGRKMWHEQVLKRKPTTMQEMEPNDCLREMDIMNSERKKKTADDASILPPATRTVTKTLGVPMKPQVVTMPFSDMNIVHTPIQCPDGGCRKLMFITSISSHYAVNHNNLVIDRLLAGQPKDLVLHPALVWSKNCKCHALYLIRNKVHDLGVDEFKDYLPMLLMTRRIKFSDIFQISKDAKETKFLLVWLAGLIAPNFPVKVKLSMMPFDGNTRRWVRATSGYVHSLQSSQDPKEIFLSNNRLILSEFDVEGVTNNYQQMLHFQITIK